MGPDTLVPLVFFLFLGAIILVPIWLRERTKQSAHKLISQALEKGQPLDPQIMRSGSLKGERDTGLTPRELEILQHIVAGKSNKQIATELNLSVNTVSVHRANIMDALGIHKTAELVVYAIRNGLANLP